MFISNIESGNPSCAFASPLSEQSGISLAVKNTLAPVPPPRKSEPFIGSYPPGEVSLSLSFNGSNCPSPVPWKYKPFPSTPVSSPSPIASYSNGIPCVKSAGNCLYIPLSIICKLVIVPVALTLDTTNLATLGGSPSPEPTFAVAVAPIVLNTVPSPKSIILTLGGFVKSYPSPPCVICTATIPPLSLSTTAPAFAPEPGVVPSPI